MPGYYKKTDYGVTGGFFRFYAILTLHVRFIYALPTLYPCSTYTTKHPPGTLFMTMLPFGAKTRRSQFNAGVLQQSGPDFVKYYIFSHVKPKDILS
jgi:hypothetical protein